MFTFTYKFDFPSFMIVIIAFFNDGTSMTLSFDRVLALMTLDSCDLATIFAFAVAYGFYFTPYLICCILIISAESTPLVCIILTTTFQNKFGVSLENTARIAPRSIDFSWLTFKSPSSPRLTVTGTSLRSGLSLEMDWYGLGTYLLILSDIVLMLFCRILSDWIKLLVI